MCELYIQYIYLINIIYHHTNNTYTSVNSTVYVHIISIIYSVYIICIYYIQKCHI